MNLNSIGIALCLAAATASFFVTRAIIARRRATIVTPSRPCSSSPSTHAPGSQPWVAILQRCARRHRAVVISPDGDYYYSRGKGLELVYKGAGAA